MAGGFVFDAFPRAYIFMNFLRWNDEAHPKHIFKMQRQQLEQNKLQFEMKLPRKLCFLAQKWTHLSLDISG